MVKKRSKCFTAKDVDRINKRMILRAKGLMPEEVKHFSLIKVKRPALKLTPQEIDEAGRRAMRKSRYVEAV